MNKVISSPAAPAAIGPYSQAIMAGDTLYVSGQLPVIPSEGIIPDGIEAQTRQSLMNIRAILEEAGFAMGDIVKTTILLADMNDFSAMNAEYSVFFPFVKPARVCFQVAALPKGALVEIDAIAVK